MTAEGNNNTGGLTLTYGYEDTDTIGDGYVFNAYDSKLWCYVRDYLADDLAALYIQLEEQLAWSATRTLTKFEEYQQVKPERLWIADMRRKYLRPYEDNGTTFYLDMMHGDKKHQRRQYEYYQEKYMASKYIGSTCTSDAITIRGYTPTSWTGVEPNGDLTITPYADTYIVVKYGSYTVQTRAKRGESYLIECPIATMNDTEVYPYNASLLSSIGDISGFYARVVDFSPAVKHTSITIGNSTTGYSNTNMTSFSVGSNTLLEYLNLQNLPNLAQAIDLSGCVNLMEFYADGSGITGVVFATGGKIETAYLPASIASITAKELSHLTDLQIEGYDNITTLLIEDSSSIDTLELVQSCENLTRVRITGIDWTLDDTTLLDEILDMAGINDSGYNQTQSVLAGSVTVPTVREQKLAEYQEAWPDLEINYSTLINQYTATFVNTDGTVLDIQYVDKGSTAVDPVTREDDPIDTPTQESSVSTNYTFSGWDTEFVALFANATYTAVYDETVRQYTVKYSNKGTILQTTEADYGTYVYYTGDTPTYTSEEAAYRYYLFTGWAESGLVDGDKTIEASYDVCEYTSGYFDGKELEDLSAVEIYAMTKVGVESSVVESQDPYSFTMGKDYDYSDIESYTLITEETAFTGSNYVDTGLSVMDEDRNFVLAIDYEFASGNSASATLAQCFQTDGSNGFKLLYNSYPRVQWGTASTQSATGTNREMLVIRHVAGETGLYVYLSNLSGTAITTTSLSKSVFNTTDATLVFGCSKADDGAYENYATGTVYWAKVWYSDLGDTACQELASYIHEPIQVEMCGFKRKYLSDSSSTRSSMSFLGKVALRTKKAMMSSYTNSGGWAESTLNTWLNSRFYAGLPVDFQQLVAQVKVISSIGDQSTELSTSNCYIYIPALYELSPSTTDEPYIYEDSTIDYITSASDRIRYDYEGNAVSYWTRSPNKSSSTYWHYVSETGSTNAYGQAPNEMAIIIEFSLK